MLFGRVWKICSGLTIGATTSHIYVDACQSGSHSACAKKYTMHGTYQWMQCVNAVKCCTLHCCGVKYSNISKFRTREINRGAPCTVVHTYVNKGLCVNQHSEVTPSAWFTQWCPGVMARCTSFELCCVAWTALATCTQSVVRSGTGC